MDVDQIKKNFVAMKEQNDARQQSEQQSRDAAWLKQKLRDIDHNSRANAQSTISLAEGATPDDVRRRLKILADALQLDISKVPSLKVQELLLHHRTTRNFMEPFYIQCTLEEFISMF